MTSLAWTTQARDWAIAGIGRRLLLPYYRGKFARFLAQHDNAAALRERFLLDRLQVCAETTFGRDHDLRRVKTIADFRQAVPITSFAGLQPYFDRVTGGDATALLPRYERILAFASTTGSTGTPKRLPVTSTWLADYQRWWQMWGVRTIVDHPGIVGKSWLQISGPLDLDRTASGHSVGMVSAISARYQNPIFQSFYCTPYQIGNVADAELRGYAMARLAMAQPVGFIITTTAANLIRLAQTGDTHKEQIIRDVHDGRLTGLDAIADASLRRLLAGRLAADPARARVLDNLAAMHGRLLPKHYWPLECITCWIGGTIGQQSNRLGEWYGTAPVRDIGYISTEGRHTVPFADHDSAGVLVPNGCFYEFLPDDDPGRPLLPHELSSGQNYSVVLTSTAGLYRTRLDDIVRCTGHIGQSPIIEFVQKTSDYSDMEGEKISAEQVLQALAAAAQACGIAVPSISIAGERPANQAPYYALLVEAADRWPSGLANRLLARLDDELRRLNLMYQQKRGDGSLAGWQLITVPEGMWSQFAQAESALRGTSDTQFKLPVFLTPAQRTRLFASLVRSPSAPNPRLS